MPGSDLPSDPKEDDEQVGGPFGNDFKCKFKTQNFCGETNASVLLIGKTPVCLTVSFSCCTCTLHAQGPKGVTFDASSQACCDRKSPGMRHNMFCLAWA